MCHSIIEKIVVLFDDNKKVKTIKKGQVCVHYSYVFTYVWYVQLKDNVALAHAYEIATRMLDTLYSMHSSCTHSFVDHRILELQ